jgi:hypothetical protein
MKGCNPVVRGDFRVGVPRPHNRKPAGPSDNELINTSVSQKDERHEMQFAKASKF